MAAALRASRHHSLFGVDFQSGISCKALKIPTEMFTVMSTIATAGWSRPENRCGRLCTRGSLAQ